LGALARTDAAPAILALGTVLATTAVKAIRWQVLLPRSSPPIGHLRVLRALLVGQLGNSFLPARLGDVGRAALLSSHTSGGFLAVMGTIVVEKTLDAVLGLLVLLGLALWSPLPTWLRTPFMVLALLTCGLLVLLLLVAGKGPRSASLAQWLLVRLPASGRIWARSFLGNLRQGLTLFEQPLVAALALCLSAAIWALGALTNVATLAALHLKVPWWGPWLVLVLGYVVNFVPTVPAQIGVFEFACIVALTAAGSDQESALAFGLVLHLLVYGPPAILGPMSMAFEGLTWTKLRNVRSEHREDKRDWA
jgi:uncharacterized protein (TIRG00374 family)